MNWLKIKKFLTIIWPLAFIFLVIIIFFWRFIFKGLLPIPADTIVGMYHPWRDLLATNYPQGVPFKNFLITDPVRQQLPWRQLVIDSFKKGQLPFWNPYNFGGTPLLANFQSAPFYIFNFLFFIFNFDIAWGILIFLQPLLSGLFMYFYLRELKLENIICIFGAIVFSFSGFSVAWMEWGTILHAGLWLPLILLSIEKIAFNFNWSENSKFKIQNSKLQFKNKNLISWSIIFIFSLAQSFFAGHLQTFFYVFLFSLIYLIWKLTQVKYFKSLIYIFAICYLLFAIFTSIQWKPTLQLIKLSAREIDQANWRQPGWFIPWKHLVQFFAPDFFGNPTTMNYFGEWNYGELVGYLGVIPLLLAVSTIFSKKNKFTIYYLVFTILILSFSLPTPWAKLPFILKIPFISTSQPTRLLFLIDFCLAILASFGAQLVIARKKEFRPVCIFILIYGLLWLITFKRQLTVSQRNLILPTAMLVGGTILLTSFNFKKTPPKLVFWGLLLLTVFDLFRFSWKFLPFTKKEWLFPSTKVIDFLKSDKEVFRVMSVDRRILPPNFSAVYKIQDVAGYDPLYLLRWGELIAASERGEPNINPPFGFNRIVTPQNFESKIIDLLNVKYILSLGDLDSQKLTLVFKEGETRVYFNKNYFPRAFLVEGVRYSSDKQQAIKEIFKSKDFLNKIAIIEDSSLLEKVKYAPLLGEEKVDLKEYQENKIRLEVFTTMPRFLVITDNFYPSWKVYINGKEDRIYQADYNFRGVIVPAGKNEVVFYFK